MYSDELSKALAASLQLPHSSATTTAVEADELPTVRILVVADIDLSSASALAEYTLQQKQKQVFDASRIDLCIACGPFCRDDDLLPYLRGKQHERLLQRKRQAMSTPFFRTREETVALEGLFTACLSQLESIVCRVVYCPGASDPLTTLLESHRLTPNSRNVHRQWLSLVPGLGCAALVYFDAPQAILPKHGPTSSRSTQPSRVDDRSTFNHDDEDGDVDPHDYDSDENEDEEEGTMAVWSEQLVEIQQNSEGYCSTLSRLLHLAPPPKNTAMSISQTILVTHYVHCLQLKDVDDSNDDPLEAASDAQHHELQPVNDDPSSETEEESSDGPWPAAHDAFCKEHLDRLCLEIASGRASQHKPRLLRKTGVHVLLPGSLRERGEFCLVDLALQQDGKVVKAAGPTKGLKSSSARPSMAWKVQNVDFHRLP